MKRLLIILIIPAIAFLGSCKRNNNVEPDTVKTMNNLIVPPDFDWKTTQTLEVEVVLPTKGDIQPLLITNRDGSVKYFRGFPDDGSRTVRTKITIPDYIIDLRFIYNGTNGPNIAYIGGSTVTYNFNNTLKSTNDDDCDLSGYITYSKGGWGQKAAGNNVGQLRDDHFDQVYPGDFVVGSGYTLTFNATGDVENFLPDGGSPAALGQSYINPDGKGKNKLGNNMADQITAARLNRDYNAAGYLGTNTAGVPLGELVFIGGPFANTTVNDFLTQAEAALGGGDMQGLSASEWASAAETIIDSFHEGVNGDVLTCPTDPEEDDPYIEVSSDCLSNEVVFTISNTGDGDMTSAYDYTVTKNNVEIATGEYELDVNQNLELIYTGLTTDEFIIVVETPRGEDQQETITGCGDPEPPINPPTEQFDGTLAYEDLWPGKGDYDFNDLVIDYTFDISKDNQENVESIEATFAIKAYGASLHNGFAFTLPNVDPSDIVSVTGYDIASSSVFNIASNGVESGQSKATIVVFDDVRRVMPQTTGGIGVNTQEEYDFIQPVTMTININFVEDAVTYNDLDIGTFNPFIIVNSVIDGSPGIRGLEIHLPYYEPSDLMDDSYFGTQDDASQPSIGKYFVTENNLPWAINIADDFDWVIEFQDITGAYLHFGEWAESGGNNYADWYKDFSGYRTNSLIYSVPSGK
mgnify:FL=1